MNDMQAWLSRLGYTGSLQVASADASFRSYYRLIENEKTFVVMDSSLQKESLTPFVDITKRLLAVSVHVPEIFAANLQKGFLLLEDLGSRDLLQVLDESNAEYYYSEAIDEIIKMQCAKTEGLPLYDAAFLRFEMALMREWYLEKYLGKHLGSQEKEIISDAIDQIVEVVLSQPQGLFVHRDFHSRNIMLTPQDEIAVIDYQDARVGAVTYDLVSLLRDLYIAFDSAMVERLALQFRDKKGLDADNETFLRWFDFTGLQRHIKVLGIFARLHLRDGKDGYLKDLPQTLKYIIEIGSRYEETRALVTLLKERQE
ncbi:MAG TPA: aminoglycoside phosphotransferase [Epsilonproteobacteria bacterium]|nr:aminoglycoside phosphotransferase [Campylobacterota bacterium]